MKHFPSFPLGLRPAAALLSVLLSGLLALGGCSADSSSPHSVGAIGAGLSGPTSLAAASVASGLEHVASLAVDADGELWAGTAAYDATGTDGVFVISGADAAPVEVVDGLSTVLGLLWVGDELYVASGTSVVAYSGFDGTSFASSRPVVTFADGVGELNGLAQLSDGRLVLGISAPCDGCDPTDSHSATIVSFRTDGSDLEVYASGIRAAVGLAVLPGTSDLFATMNQRDDLGTATPGDWLSVVTEGQDWLFPECWGQSADSTCAAQPDPVAELDAHAAVSGVAFITASDGSPTAIVAEWATGKLVLVDLDGDDPTAPASVSGTITGMQNPVAVTTAADGTVYAGDWTTGTVYHLAAS